MIVQEASLGFFVIGIALTVLGQRLAAKKSPKDKFDDKATTLSSRGSSVRYLIGRDKIGYVFGKAYDRRTIKEKGGSKKGLGGGGGGKTKVYYEGGTHFLLVGPGDRLHGIYQNGLPICRGPIDSCSHPSGTVIQLGKEGEFAIYWGEVDQPISTFLSDPTRLGIASRWPLVMRIDWITKRLGPSPNWPLLEYDSESYVKYSALTKSPSYLQQTRTPLSDPIPILTALLSTTADGGPVPITPLVGNPWGTNSTSFTPSFRPEIMVDGLVKALFPPDRKFFVVGSGLPQNNLNCFKSEHDYDYDPGQGSPVYPRDATRIYLGSGFSNFEVETLSGYVVPYLDNGDDGPNPAHSIYQLMFGPWPYGLSRDTALYDIDSLEVVGQICFEEHLTCMVSAQQGDTLESKLAELMLDMGLFISWDIILGKFRFELIRTPTGSLPTLPQAALLPPLPEIEKQHRSTPIDKPLFTFRNRDLKFNKDNIVVDDDGQASRLEYQSAQTIEMGSINDFPTASMVAERRSQEELGDKAKINFQTNRDTRRMVPGQAFLVEGMNVVFRLLDIGRTDSSRKVKATAIKDFYGVDASTFSHTGGQGPGTPAHPDADLAFAPIEVPSMLSPGVMTLVVPRIRSDPQITSSVIWLSRDNTSYIDFDEDFDIQTGGTLESDLPLDRPWEIEELDSTNNPVILIEGGDVGTVAFLNDTLWRSGRQLLVIAGAFGYEIFHLKGLQALGSGRYQTGGLISARYDTPKEFHAAGSRVFIFFFEDILPVQHVLLAPSSDIYVKSQPRTIASAISLASVTPESILPLHGKGVVPMRPCALRTTNMYDGWFTGDDVILRWGYRSALIPNSGAGLQGFGIPAARAPVDGEFLVEFYDSSDVLKHSETVAGVNVGRNGWTYPNADIVTDFGGEPSEIRIKLYNQSIGGGFKSYPELLTINLL